MFSKDRLYKRLLAIEKLGRTTKDLNWSVVDQQRFGLLTKSIDDTIAKYKNTNTSREMRIEGKRLRGRQAGLLVLFIWAFATMTTNLPKHVILSGSILVLGFAIIKLFWNKGIYKTPKHEVTCFHDMVKTIYGGVSLVDSTVRLIDIDFNIYCPSSVIVGRDFSVYMCCVEWGDPTAYGLSVINMHGNTAHACLFDDISEADIKLYDLMVEIDNEMA